MKDGHWDGLSLNQQLDSLKVLTTELVLAVGAFKEYRDIVSEAQMAGKLDEISADRIDEVLTRLWAALDSARAAGIGVGDGR